MFNKSIYHIPKYFLHYNKNPFITLGLNYNPNEKQLKDVYKKLLLKYHPDKNNNNHHDFYIIKNAYDDVLKNINNPKYYSSFNTIKNNSSNDFNKNDFNKNDFNKNDYNKYDSTNNRYYYDTSFNKKSSNKQTNKTKNKDINNKYNRYYSTINKSYDNECKEINSNKSLFGFIFLCSFSFGMYKITKVNKNKIHYYD